MGPEIEVGGGGERAKAPQTHVPPQHPRLFEPAGTVLTVEQAGRGLAIVEESYRGVLGGLRWTSGPTPEEMMEPRLYLTPPGDRESMRRDLDAKVEAGLAQMRSSHEPGPWGIASEEQYTRSVGGSLSAFWSENYAKIMVRHYSGVDVNETLRDLTVMADVTLCKAVECGRHTTDMMYGPPTTDFMVAAAGSYGRGELLPNSDLDLFLVYGGDGQTAGPDARKTAPVFRSSTTNENYFRELLAATQNLLSGTGIGNVHERGPFSANEFLERADRGSEHWRLFRTDLLNTRLLYGTGDIGGWFTDRVVELAYREPAAGELVGNMMRVVEYLPRHVSMTRANFMDYIEDGITLKYTQGGERTMHFIHHLGQLADPRPPEEKVSELLGVHDGIAALAGLDEEHPFHITLEEARTLHSAFNWYNRILVSAKTGFNVSSDWNMLRDDVIDRLAESEGVTSGEYKARLESTMGEVHRIWRRMADRYAESGRG